MKAGKTIVTISVVAVLVLGTGLWMHRSYDGGSVSVEKVSIESKSNPVVTPQPKSPQQVVEKKDGTDISQKPIETKEDVKKPEVSITTETATTDEKLGWYYKPNKEHKLPEVSAKGKALLEEYSGFYHGDVSNKTIYLTFDEGYENGYTPQILDALKASNVKAAFFITGDYLRRNPELVKRMVREGHIVGNHTNNHPSLPTLNNETLEKEIISLSNSFQELTGSKMSYLRPPMGEYSERSLKITHEMGYRNVFWSVAMVDWQPDAGTPEENKKTVMDRIHSGAVILLHAVNKANAEMLPTLIQDCKEQGYQFNTLDHI